MTHFFLLNTSNITFEQRIKKANPFNFFTIDNFKNSNVADIKYYGMCMDKNEMRQIISLIAQNNNTNNAINNKPILIVTDERDLATKLVEYLNRHNIESIIIDKVNSKIDKVDPTVDKDKVHVLVNNEDMKISSSSRTSNLKFKKFRPTRIKFFI